MLNSFPMTKVAKSGQKWPKMAFLAIFRPLLWPFLPLLGCRMSSMSIVMLFGVLMTIPGSRFTLGTFKGLFWPFLTLFGPFWGLFDTSTCTPMSCMPMVTQFGILMTNPRSKLSFGPFLALLDPFWPFLLHLPVPHVMHINGHLVWGPNDESAVWITFAYFS